jgi:hypothetical protein
MDLNFLDYMCKLNKALYRIKQAPQVWFKRLSQSIINIGFIGSQVDHSPFTYKYGGALIYILIYVNDILIMGYNDSFISFLVAKLHVEFALGWTIS